MLEISASFITHSMAAMVNIAPMTKPTMPSKKSSSWIMYFAYTWYPTIPPHTTVRISDICMVSPLPLGTLFPPVVLPAIPCHPTGNRFPTIEWFRSVINCSIGTSQKSRRMDCNHDWRMEYSAGTQRERKVLLLQRRMNIGGWFA